MFLALGACLVLALAGWFGWMFCRTRALWRDATTAERSGDWGRVESALAKLAWYRPSDLAALRLRVFAALQRGDREAAADLLASVPDSSDEAPRAHLDSGRLYKELFKLREAEAEFRACLRLEPGLADDHRELIIMFGVQRRSREQREQLWALHDRGGRALEALRMLAQASPVIPPGALSKTADEGLVLERALAADPDAPHVRPALAHFYRGRGDTEGARRVLEPWIRVHPDDLPARVEWLSLLVDQAETEVARPWLERLEGQARADSGFWAVRGDWLRLQDRSAESVDSLREAARLDPLGPAIRFRLSAALRSAGRVREAEEELERWSLAHELAEVAGRVSEESPDAGLMVTAGQLCTRLDRVREARAWFRQALRVDPGNAEARAALAAAARAGSTGDEARPSSARGS
jgi:tetratricopeptide (TPR) repeat protein